MKNSPKKNDDSLSPFAALRRKADLALFVFELTSVLLNAIFSGLSLAIRYQSRQSPVYLIVIVAINGVYLAVLLIRYAIYRYRVSGRHPRKLKLVSRILRLSARIIATAVPIMLLTIGSSGSQVYDTLVMIYAIISLCFSIPLIFFSISRLVFLLIKADRYEQKDIRSAHRQARFSRVYDAIRRRDDEEKEDSVVEVPSVDKKPK